MAYHLATRVLERMAGRQERALFAMCARHLIAADIPVRRHIQAGLALESARPAGGVLERHVRELFALDINPIAQLVRRIQSMPVAIHAWNVYNESADLHVRWVINSSRSGLRRPAPQVVDAKLPDPVPCRDVALTFLDVIMETVSRSAKTKGEKFLSPVWSVSDLAQLLGRQGRVVHEASLFSNPNAAAT